MGPGCSDPHPAPGTVNDLPQGNRGTELHSHPKRAQSQMVPPQTSLPETEHPQHPSKLDCVVFTLRDREEGTGKRAVLEKQVAVVFPKGSMGAAALPRG